MSHFECEGNMWTSVNISHSQSCCQKATTIYKRHHQNFQNSPSSWESVAGYTDCAAQDDCVGLGGVLLRCITWSLLLILAVTFSGTASAQIQPRKQIQLDFEDEQLHWRAESPQLSEYLKTREIIDNDGHSGQRCESYHFQSAQYLEEQRLVLDVPPSKVLFDELKASLWVRSTTPDLRFVLRLRFPNQIDPRTGQTLTLDLSGETYTDTMKWQRLECATSAEAVERRLILARAQFEAQGNSINIDARTAYVDQIALLMTIPKGATAVRIDDVNFGPIISPQELASDANTQRQAKARLQVVDDRILKDDKPFFPVFTLYHGESLTEIQATGVNTLWITDYADQALLRALHDADIGAIAQPPQLTPEEAVLNRKGLPAFEEWTEPIWAWMFGYGIPEEDIRYIESWVEHVRDADRQLRRPILADVAGKERSFHRNVNFLGSSQFVIHSDISMPRHAKQLKHRRNLALPGKPMFTFVQTEASPAFLDYRGEGERLPVVEPEQILQQAYAAIAAGYKGVGFWKQYSLDTDVPGLNERVHAIRLFASHCKILEPWLATGRVVDDLFVHFDADMQHTQTGLLAPLKSRWDTPIEQISATGAKQPSEILATVIRSDEGLLILPVWYEEGEQCVPGPQAVSGIRMLLKGDIWQAWEVTPVGVTQSNLEVSWPAGGTEIYLKEFDQQSAIVITSKPNVIERLQRESRRVRDDAARAMVSLAALKFERVQNVHEELIGISPPVVQAELDLRQAYASLETASKELDASHPVEAYAAAQKSLQHLRSLQRKYWDAAIKDLPSATTSLDATGFQTLPDHWRTMIELGKRSRITENLIPTGDFESVAAMKENWSDGSTRTGNQRIQIQYDQRRNDHHLTFQLESTPGENSAIALTSPAVHAEAGDIVVISAQVRTASPFPGPEDAFLIFDTLVGRPGAVRLHEAKQEWQTVKLVRRVSRDSDFRVRLELQGNGAVEIDDLQVKRLLPE